MMKKFIKKKQTDKPLNEVIIKQVGFRKKWLDDKSGYWWEKTLRSRMIPVNILYDQDRDELILRTKVLNDYKPFKRESSWSFIQIMPATVLNLKRIIVNGALIAATK
jgi:hypothetical protein